MSRVFIACWLVSICVAGGAQLKPWPEGERRIAAYRVDGLELLERLREDRGEEGEIPRAERWTGEVPNSRFLRNDDRLWDLTTALSSKVVPVFEPGKGAWAIFNDSTGRLVARGTFMDHALLQFILDWVPDQELISVEATLWRVKAEPEKRIKVGRVGVVARSGQKEVGWMIGDNAEMSLETMSVHRASDGVIYALIDFQALVGDEEVVLKTVMEFGTDKPRSIEVAGVGQEGGRFNLELQVRHHGGRREGEFEKLSDRSDRKGHLDERKRLPGGPCCRQGRLVRPLLSF